MTLFFTQYLTSKFYKKRVLFPEPLLHFHLYLVLTMNLTLTLVTDYGH